jgi:hypothetical protein
MEHSSWHTLYIYKILCVLSYCVHALYARTHRHALKLRIYSVFIFLLPDLFRGQITFSWTLSIVRYSKNYGKQGFWKWVCIFSCNLPSTKPGLRYSYGCSYLTYLRSWALLEELSIVQPLKNPPAFYGTRRFNTVFTRALHWSLSWAISIQSIPSHTLYWHN